MERTKELDKHWARNYWCNTCQFYTGQVELHRGHSCVLLQDETLFNNLSLAAEFGYRGAEKGWNLQRTIQELTALFRRKGD